MDQGKIIAHILSNQSIDEPRLTAILYHLLFREDFRSFIEEKTEFNLSGYVYHDCFAHVIREMIGAAGRKQVHYGGFDYSNIDMILSDILLERQLPDESLLIKWPRTQNKMIMIPGTDKWREIVKSSEWLEKQKDEYKEEIEKKKDTILRRAAVINTEADLLIVTANCALLIENKVRDDLDEKQAMRYLLMLEMISGFFGDQPSTHFLLINSTGSTPESLKQIKRYNTSVLSWKAIALWAESTLSDDDQTYLKTVMKNASEHPLWAPSDEPDAWHKE